MTTNQNNIPEPTALTSVAVGKRGGETVVAVRSDDDSVPWMLLLEPGYFEWHAWPSLCDELTDIRVVDVAEVAAENDRLTDRVAELEAAVTRAKKAHREPRARLLDRIEELEAAKPEPGPWLRGDELKAVMPTLKAGDVVEVESKGHTATGELWAHSPSGLSLWLSLVRTSDGNPGPYVGALRIIERAPEPEPGADIHFEVAAAAGEKIMELADEFIRVEVLRAALAAADAKRAELEG